MFDKLNLNHMDSLNFKESVKYSLESTPILKCEDDNLKETIATSVIFAKRNLNYNSIHEQDVDFIINKLIVYLKSDFNFLRLSEIFVAFKYGSLGRFGTHIGFSVSTFIKWVQEYINDEERILVLRDKIDQSKKKLISESQTLAAEKNEQAGLSLLKAAFEVIKSGEKYNDIGGVVLDFLIEKKIVNGITADRIACWQVACDSLFEEYLNKKCLTVEEKRTNDLLIADLKSGKSAIVKSEGDKIFLNKLISEFISDGLMVDDLIN